MGEYLIDDETYNNLREWVRNYINDYCIIKQMMPGKKPGTMYSWCFYLRNGLFNPDFNSAVSQMFIYKIEREIGHFDFQISGLETGSTPLLLSIPLISRVYNLNINAFSIRKEQKTYALKNWIEGIPNDKPIMIVDDLSSSGDSMMKAIFICDQHKLNVMNHCFSIVNKVFRNANQKNSLLPTNMKVISLFELEDFDLGTPRLVRPKTAINKN